MYDDNLAKIFVMNFQEAYRSAKLLILSHERIEALIPLTPSRMKNLTIDDLDKLDAFRVRFCDLQDALGSKVFRSIIKLEEEETETQLDVINKIEKRHIIPSFESWKKIREIRNLFSHDYPESDEQRSESINTAYENTMILIETLDNINAYVQRSLKLPMKGFPLLNKKG